VPPVWQMSGQSSAETLDGRKPRLAMNNATGRCGKSAGHWRPHRVDGLARVDKLAASGVKFWSRAEQSSGLQPAVTAFSLSFCTRPYDLGRTY